MTGPNGVGDLMLSLDRTLDHSSNGPTICKKFKILKNWFKY